MPFIVAFSGWAKSGKDTAAKYLIDNHKFTRVAFADKLKEMVADEYNIPLQDMHVQERKEVPILHLPVIPKDKFSLNLANFMFREFRSQDGRIPMELVTDASGTTLGLMSYKQAFGQPDVAQLYWTPRALCILKGSVNRTVTSDYWTQKSIRDIKSLTTSSNFVISDLRYKNELNQLKQAFGKDVITVRINRFDNCESTDPSERDLDDGKFDVVIENKTSLEDLLKQVEALNGTKS